VSFLGVDVGGSHCRCEWWPPGNRPASDAQGAQPAVHGVDAAVHALADVLQRAAATAPPTAALCAIAGVGDAAMARAIEAGVRARGIAFPVVVAGDVIAAAAAGLAEGPGVLIWSGTGSFAIARSEKDELVRVGGRGFQFGDQGSGFDIVRRAIMAALRAVDGLGPATALVDALTRAFAATSPERLGAAAQMLPPAAVAAKLAVVLDAYSAGDKVAGEVVGQAVFDLRRLGEVAADRAGLPGLSDTPVALGGGVLAGNPSIADALAQLIAVEGHAQPRLCKLDVRAAARGAAWLAHQFHLRIEPAFSWVQRVAV
jgi:glucosamine kinase